MHGTLEMSSADVMADMSAFFAPACVWSAFRLLTSRVAPSAAECVFERASMLFPSASSLRESASTSAMSCGRGDGRLRGRAGNNVIGRMFSMPRQLFERIAPSLCLRHPTLLWSPMPVVTY